MSRRSVQFFDHTGFQQGQVSGMAFGQDRSIVLVGFAAILWLVIREEVPANQRDMVTLLLGTPAMSRPDVKRLSGRESQVLREIATGFTTKAIASKFGVSVKTIQGAACSLASGVYRLTSSSVRPCTASALES